MVKVLGIGMMMLLAGCAHRPAVPCESHLQPINGFVRPPLTLPLPSVSVAPPTLVLPPEVLR